ncbi:glutathione S-transferase N-terminal domain-containing protein [Steroidobacter cummioxidans]|uniref:glutathione S-transferase N-terminal domain-containing protein n=1 Tax=Steroidobacter cummioxidans TaxID=1803913 RepID=UPI0032E4BFDD
MRARLALDVSSLAFEVVEVALRDKPADMLRASPKGTVPVLIDTDGTVIERKKPRHHALGLCALNDPEAMVGSGARRFRNHELADPPFR